MESLGHLNQVNRPCYGYIFDVRNSLYSFDQFIQLECSVLSRKLRFGEDLAKEKVFFSFTIISPENELIR